MCDFLLQRLYSAGNEAGEAQDALDVLLAEHGAALGIGPDGVGIKALLQSQQADATGMQ